MHAPTAVSRGPRYSSPLVKFVKAKKLHFRIMPSNSISVGLFAFVVPLLLLLSGVRYAEGFEKIDLGGSWQVTNENESVSVPATVPGSVYTSLMAAQIIGDPYMENNDVLYRWVANDSWTYSRNFTLTKEQLLGSNLRLICEGLDTVSTITVNGQTVGESTNMFIRYEFELKDILREGSNTISIAFKSAIKYALQRWEDHLKMYDVPPDCPPDIQHGICHPNFIRKEQSSFAWDWGPGFAPQGIWRDIRVEAFSCAAIKDVVAEAIPASELNVLPWSIKIIVYLRLGSTGFCTGLVTVELPSLGIVKMMPVTLDLKTTNVTIQFDVPSAESWWPVGFGEQPLYDVNITFQNKNQTAEVSTKSIRFGFRCVELVQTEISGSSGLSFYFKINHQPIFIKGANWIPADAFQERVTPDRLANLLQSLLDANMHATRVWGGGVYEQEAFYEMCDTLGIVVWQDFQFACAMYPVDDDILDSVIEEVRHQVRRLASHPSVIAWSANNENEVALRQNWYGTASNFSLYRRDYVHLYVDTILKTLSEENTNLPAVSSSPSNGPESEQEGWIATDPTDPHYGDVHFYNYNDDCWNISIFPRPRFASEYGFQSWPSFDTLKKVSKTGDWSLNSDFSVHRQHHPSGNMQMMKQIKRHFNVSSSTDQTQQFIDTIFLTQISQALCYKFETEHYRRLQSSLVNGEGRTMGAVYWQLNDIWQAPSWASTEYGGKWKMLHYYAKDFFAPLLASGVEEDGLLSVFVISDALRPIVGGSINVTVWTWASQTPLKTWVYPFNQPSQSAKSVFNRKTADILSEAKCIQREACFMTFRVTSTSPVLSSPVNPFFLSSFSSAVGMKSPKIKTGVSATDDPATFSIKLTTDSVAPFVWMDAHDLPGRFSNNGFVMTERTRVETFHAWEATAADTLNKTLTVRSLMDIY